MLLSLLLLSGPAEATYTPVYDTGDTGDTGDSGDGGSVVVPLPNNDYDGHLDGQLAYQMAGDKGGCATVGGPGDLVLALGLVGAAAGRLRRPRR